MYAVHIDDLRVHLVATPGIEDDLNHSVGEDNVGMADIPIIL